MANDDVIETELEAMAFRLSCDGKAKSAELVMKAAAELRASRARVAELEQDRKLLAEVVQAPFPLHDYCSEEAWTRACNIVAAMAGEGEEPNNE